MNNMVETQKQIVDFAKKKRIFTTKELAKNLNIDKNRKGQIYTILSRLCKKNILHRYEKGIYGYVIYSPLFKQYSYMPYSKALTEIFMSDDNGYITGADFCYTIGLSTWCAAKATIVVNGIQRKKIIDTTVFMPAKTKITAENKWYLQLLDFFENKDSLAVDAPNPSHLIISYMNKRNIELYKLIALAKRYYNKRTLNNLVNTIEENYFETAR